MSLTDMKCKSAKPKEKAYKLFDGQGLYLDVRPTGSKYWRLKYHLNSKEKLLALGVYPNVSLQAARDKRYHAKELIEQGIDPSLDKRKSKALANEKADNTFEAVAREWYELNKSKWSERYAEGVINRLETYIFPEIGNYPITDIEPPILLQAIRKIENRPAIEIAKRQNQKCGEIFQYAISCGKGVRNPALDIVKALKPQKTENYASFDIKELPEFLNILERNEARLYKSTHNAIKLIMFTFVRTSELINARWEEIDLDKKEWIIPAERMKMKKGHIVPLSSQAVEIFKEQKKVSGAWPHVFPSVVRPKNSMSNNAILSAIKRMGYKGKMTGHGFRALAMTTIKQELGWRHEVIDRQLAHAPKNKTARAYDRAAFLKDRKIMMQQYADYIDKLRDGI